MIDDNASAQPNREGWLFLPELFSQEEVSLLARGCDLVSEIFFSHVPLSANAQEPRLQRRAEAI